MCDVSKGEVAICAPHQEPEDKDLQLNKAETPTSDVKEKSTDSEEKEAKTKRKLKGGKIEINGKFYNTGRWTEEEHKKFMKGIDLYGKDWKKVQQLVGTRTSAQSRSHAQKVLPKAMNSKESGSSFATPKSPVKEKDLHTPLEEVPFSNLNTKSKCNDKSKNISEPEINKRKRGHTEQFEDFAEIQASSKRKCTIDVSSLNPVDDLCIQDDDLSLKLLRKLTTPQKPARYQSFCYPLDHNGAFKLEFNSDIESLGDEAEIPKMEDFFPGV